MAKYAEAAPIILRALEDGDTQKAAAEKAGVHIDTFHDWINNKPEFSEAVKRAKRNALANSVAKVERSLLDRALGFEYEEVRSEYESKPDPNDPNKYIPTIKRQIRTKKHIVQDVEAIKFFLTNRAPDEWKNRQEHEITNLELLQNMRVERVNGNSGTSGLISHSEDEIPD